MKARTILLVAALSLQIVLPGSGLGNEADFSGEMKALLSRLQAMGHGYHSDSEWSALFGEIDELTARAETAHAWNVMVDIFATKASVMSDMLNDHEGALRLLDNARRQYSHMNLPSMRRVFVKQADIHAKLGNERAIANLISEYKASPLYDPQGFTYSGGQGRAVPLAVTRPDGRGDDSLTVSTMEMHRQRALYASGKYFPDFEATDIEGRTVRLNDYRGKIVLVDFWIQGSATWLRQLSELKGLYERYNRSGFEVLGVNIERDPSTVPAFVAGNKIRWRQIAGDNSIPRKVGVFGDACNFLIDENGFIIGRNLHGQELAQAVRRALKLE